MKKILSLLLLFVLASSPSVFGQFPDRVRSLRGVPIFSVSVESIEEEYVRMGFNDEDYKTAVDLRLRSLGISFVSFPDGFVPFYYKRQGLTNLPL